MHCNVYVNNKSHSKRIKIKRKTTSGINLSINQTSLIRTVKLNETLNDDKPLTCQLTANPQVRGQRSQTQRSQTQGSQTQGSEVSRSQGLILSHLQQQHQLRVLDVDGDVERRLVELTERVHVGSVFDERLGDAVVTVLRCPVQSRHLQHVFGVDVCAALKDRQ